MDLDSLIKIRKATTAAIRSRRALDRCHKAYIHITNRSGFSRALTTIYCANAYQKSMVFKSDIKRLKMLLETVIKSGSLPRNR
jgi:hypothetical protein